MLTRWVKRRVTMADVLLGQAYFLRFDPKLWQAQQPYAPLGTLYAAAYLRERGHSVGAVRRDAGASPSANGRDALERASPAHRRRSTKTASTT